jgi:hypothetical protein
MSTIKFTVDPTINLYQDRESWLQAVKVKYGKNGETVAACCDELIVADVQTMDQCESMTGMTIEAVLARAERKSGCQFD